MSGYEQQIPLKMEVDDDDDYNNNDAVHGQHPPGRDINSIPDPDDPEAREEALRQELAGVNQINSVIEGVITSLDKARENMTTVQNTINSANTMLDLWIRILSQTEHTQRLLLNENWKGLTNDVEEIERDKKRAEEARRRAAEERARQQAEREKREERERAAREAAERKASLAVRGRRTPGLGTRRSGTSVGESSMSSSSTRGSSSSTRGTRGGIGRGIPSVRGRGMGLGRGIR